MIRGIGLVAAMTLNFAASGLGAAQPMTVSCKAPSSKAQNLTQICNLFVARLQAAHPTRVFQAPAAQMNADVQLVVLSSTPRLFSARIDQGTTEGQPLATARDGAGLSQDALTNFLDQLIAQSPLS